MNLMTCTRGPMMSMLNKVSAIIDNTSQDNILYKQKYIQYRDDYFSKVYWNYFPATDKYFFEGNPSFLHEYKNMFDCGSFPLIMARDGYVGILEFFFENPKPPRDFKSVILINKKFEKLIPKKWKDNVAVYSISANRKITKSDSKRFLIIYGNTGEDIFWKDDPKILAKKYAEIASEFDDVICILPQKEPLLSSYIEQVKNHNLTLLKEIYRNFGFDVKIAYNFNKFFENNKVKHFSFLNIDQNNVFVSDSYYDYFLSCKKGYSLNNQNNFSTNCLRYSLSQYHEVVIEEASLGESLFPEFFIQYKMFAGRTMSLYDIYQSKLFKKLYIKYFFKDI